MSPDHLGRDLLGRERIDLVSVEPGGTPRTTTQRRREVAQSERTAAGGPTLTLVLQRYLERMEGEVRAGRSTPATLATHRQRVAHLVRILEVDAAGRETRHPIVALGWDDVRCYVRERRVEGAVDAIVAGELVPLRGALRQAAEEGLWPGDIPEVWLNEFLPRTLPRPRWLTRRALHRLLAELEPEHAAIVAFVVATSAPWCSVAYARRCDVFDEESLVRVRSTRRATRHRLVPIETDDQRRLLERAFVAEERTDDPLFVPWPEAHHDLRLACARARITACSTDDLRRTLGGWMWQEGVPAPVVARRMGYAGDPQIVERTYGPARTGVGAPPAEPRRSTRR